MAVYRHMKATTTAAMQSAVVRKALADKAQELAARANSLGSGEGVTMNAKVVEGTRPKGRPFANVESDNVGQEWGDRFTERRRILGRVAEGA